MAKIKTLEKYKGEFNGEYRTLWIGISVNNNVFMAGDLQLKQVGNKIENDVANTVWKHISNEFYGKIKDQMHCVHNENYLKTEDSPKHKVPTLKKNIQDKGMSM